jgi:hypothetical protein
VNSEKAGLSTVFMGIAMRISDNKREYALAVHDGMGLVGSELDVREGEVPDNLVSLIIDRAKEYAKARGHRVSVFHFCSVTGN